MERGGQSRVSTEDETFYWPDITGKHITVTGTGSKAYFRVLRMQEGDMLILFDGSLHRLLLHAYWKRRGQHFCGGC